MFVKSDNFYFLVNHIYKNLMIDILKKYNYTMDYPESFNLEGGYLLINTKERIFYNAAGSSSLHKKRKISFKQFIKDCLI